MNGQQQFETRNRRGMPFASLAARSVFALCLLFHLAGLNGMAHHLATAVHHDHTPGSGGGVGATHHAGHGDDEPALLEITGVCLVPQAPDHCCHLAHHEGPSIPPTPPADSKFKKDPRNPALAVPRADAVPARAVGCAGLVVGTASLPRGFDRLAAGRSPPSLLHV